MTNFIFHFPARTQGTLACVWIATGNPAQPLICRWFVDPFPVEHAHETAEEREACALCA
jgi:hypothetical protein